MIHPKPSNQMPGLPPDPHRNHDPGTNPSRSRHPAITTGRVLDMPTHGITKYLRWKQYADRGEAGATWWDERQLQTSADLWRLDPIMRRIEQGPPASQLPDNRGSWTRQPNVW